jgi:hypothetical protein
MLQACKDIISQEGVKGLMKGVTAGILRGFVGSAAQLGAFTTTKKILVQKQVK